MPIACDAESLAGLSNCLVETFTRQELKAIRVYLLCNLVNGVTVATDPKSLATNSRCLMDTMSAGQLYAAETYLLCQLAGIL